MVSSACTNTCMDAQESTGDGMSGDIGDNSGCTNLATTAGAARPACGGGYCGCDGFGDPWCGEAGVGEPVGSGRASDPCSCGSCDDLCPKRRLQLRHQRR